jgi:hypothetical protein
MKDRRSVIGPEQGRANQISLVPPMLEEIAFFLPQSSSSKEEPSSPLSVFDT